MSNSTKESSPMITPDTLRKVNQMNQAFYETHTKKNYGRTDTWGSQYSGTIENFGSEALLESRKLLMEKPSLEGVFRTNGFKTFFNLQYSNMIETYDQQGMIEAVLKKDAFLSNKEYRIRFVDCEDVYITRSESWGALNTNTPSNVYKNKFIHTKTAPILLIKDINSGVVDEVDLRLEIDEDFDVDYYFYNEFATQRFIDTYSDGILETCPITDNDSGLPFVWICEEIFRSLPPLNIDGIELIVGKPFLSIGTDGHNVSHIYPLIYGTESLPTQSTDGTWYLKAWSELDGFIEGGDNNHTSKISSISLSFISNETGVETKYPVSFEEDYIKITLSDRVEWDIIRDSINEPYYARIELVDTFIQNTSTDTNNLILQAFDIGFSDNYYFNPYEGLCEGAESGIHIDISSDYSQNSVPKKNGIIHRLGEFDGLPSYLKSFHTENINRSHVVLYTIRDRLNRYTQNPTSKQTAALLIDSAMPQNELIDVSLSQEPAIVYKNDDGKFQYVTEKDKVVSMSNVVSEITFIDKNNFGNSRIPSNANKRKFIYHGNMTFSLNAVEFDKELETARVYYINNDSIMYRNNDSVNDGRSPLTLARICDIPTSFEQLMHIENVSATYVFDPKYVRMYAGFDNIDLDYIMNQRRSKIVRTRSTTNVEQWIYDPRRGLPQKQELIDNGYYRTVNIYNTDIPITSENFNVLAGGTGYDVGDTFYCLVGGKAFDGVVTRTVLGGSVYSVEIDVSDDSTISYYNTTGTNTPLKTETVESLSGDGNLQLELVISQSDIEAHKPRTDSMLPPPEGLVAFMRDYFGNIFMYSLQNDWSWKEVCQVEGDEYRKNIYDTDDILLRTFDNVYKHRILNSPSYASDQIFFNPSEFISEITVTDYPDARGHKGETDRDDLSQYIVAKNMPNTFYQLICTDDSDNGHFDLKMFQAQSPDGYKTTLPRYNINNTVEYYNPTNRLLPSFSELNIHQPTLFVYSPSHDYMIDNYIKPDMMNHIADTLIVKSTHKTSYNDYGSNIVDSSGKLTSNVYYYPEYEFSDSYNRMREYLYGLSRYDLLSYIRNNMGSNSEPLKFENSDYKYSIQELVDYILNRYPMDGPYIKDGLKVRGFVGDQIINPISGEIIGDSVTGGFISVTTDIFDASVNADGMNVMSTPENIFIIEDVSFPGFSNTFRVHDENGTDITSSSIIIWHGNKYIFYDDEWVQLAKSVVEGYYNINDKMFYHDQNYQNIIVPDIDLIYKDLPSGEVYKWDGSNYILINI